MKDGLPDKCLKTMHQNYFIRINQKFETPLEWAALLQKLLSLRSGNER